MVETRAFRFVFELFVPAREASAHLWVPRPLLDGWQQVRATHDPPGLERAEGVDPSTGNRMVRFTLPASASPTSLEVAYEVVRTQRCHAPPAPLPGDALGPDDPLQRYLRPDRKVPLDGAVAQLAREVNADGEVPSVKARKAFEHLLSTLSYDTGGCTPERADQLGNLAAACDLKTGTCTEFHGLYVGCLRALGVPARFTFGFNLPRDSAGGRVKGYHCWSEAHLPGAGWFPVDVSEAWKRRELTDFYFGSLDADRVAFSFDRDVMLAPPQQAEPLDKWIFPHAECAGRPLKPHLGFRCEAL